MPVIQAKDQQRVNMRREQAERFLASSSTVSEWCRLNKVSESTLYKWMAYCSVVATARANGLNPRLYVEWLLAEMPNAGELTDEVVDGFMPWSGSVPDSCRLSPADAARAVEAAAEPILDADRDLLDDEMANNLEEPS